jgi:hypothetical protein
VNPLSAQALLLGALGGATLSATGWALTPRPLTAARRTAEARRIRHARGLLRRGAVALAVALLTAIATRWPVAGLAAGALVMAWDKLAGGARAERLATRRLEALAAWAEALRDTLAGAVGLEQAIPATVRIASPLLAGPLRALAERMSAREPLPDALYALADDLNDPDADLVIAALILGARLHGPGLRAVLTSLAASARAGVEMRERVTAQRASSRRAVQLIVAVVAAALLGSALLDHGFVAAYDTAAGQGVLAAILSIFAAAFAWLRRLAGDDPATRILLHPDQPQGAAP